MKFIVSLIILFLSISCLMCFKVGFFSLNLEGNTLNESDQIGVLNSLTKINLDKTLSPILTPEFNNFDNKSLDTYEVLYISFQELAASCSLNPIKSQIKKNGKFECDEKYNKSIGGRGASFRKNTQILVCWNKTRFRRLTRDSKVYYRSFVFSKAVIGICVLDLNSNQDYCFFGVHAETSFDSAITTNYVGFLESLKRVFPNAIAFVLGDSNILSSQKSFFDKTSNKEIVIPTQKDANSKETKQKIFKDFQDFLIKRAQASSLEDFLNDKNQQNYKMQNNDLLENGDANSLILFQNLFNKLYNNKRKKEISRYKLTFLGNKSLRRLNPTYKYLSNAKLEERTVLNMNLKKMSKLKLVHSQKDIKVANENFAFGFNDRLFCFEKELANFDNLCKVDDKSVIYKMVPKLRISDHMPIVGIFEIDEATSTKDGLLKKVPNKIEYNNEIDDSENSEEEEMKKREFVIEEVKKSILLGFEDFLRKNPINPPLTVKQIKELDRKFLEDQNGYFDKYDMELPDMGDDSNTIEKPSLIDSLGLAENEEKPKNENKIVLRLKGGNGQKVIDGSNNNEENPVRNVGPRISPNSSVNNKSFKFTGKKK